MAAPSTLFRFRITADQIKTPVDIRVAMHPSETKIFMITLILAYALNYQDGIEFGAGLSEPDAPAIRVIGTRGEISLWIDVGNPSARRLHKSAKAATSVMVYTYKNVEQLKKDVVGEKIYNSHKIQIFAINSDFLETLSELVERDNQWKVSLTGDELEVTIDDEGYSCTLKKHSLG
jgi:uncharacterized protein YaeQ